MDKSAACVVDGGPDGFAVVAEEDHARGGDAAIIWRWELTRHQGGVQRCKLGIAVCTDMLCDGGAGAKESSKRAARSRAGGLWAKAEERRKLTGGKI